MNRRRRSVTVGTGESSLRDGARRRRRQAGTSPAGPTRRRQRPVSRSAAVRGAQNIVVSRLGGARARRPASTVGTPLRIVPPAAARRRGGIRRTGRRRPRRRRRRAASGRRRRRNLRRASAPSEEILLRRQKLFLERTLKETSVRETAYADTNIHPISHKWRMLLRKAKVSSLKLSLVVIRDLHETSSSLLDAQVQRLGSDVQSIGLLHKTVEKNHNEHLEELTKLQRAHVAVLKEEYNRRLSALKTDHHVDLRDIAELKKDAVVEVGVIVSEMERRQARSLQVIRKEAEFATQGIMDRHHRELVLMENAMKRRIADVETLTKDESAASDEPLQQRYTRYLHLRHEHAGLDQDIREENARIRKQEAALTTWKAKWLNARRENGLRNEALLTTIQKLRKAYRIRKASMDRARKRHKKSLVDVVKSSGACEKELKRKAEVGEAVISAYLLAQKCEEGEEAFMGQLTPKREPNLEVNRTKSSPDAVRAARLESTETNLFMEPPQTRDPATVEKFLATADELEPLVQKMNRVKLDVEGLKGERQLLGSQNKRLKALLKRYIEGFSVNSEVLDRPNPLFRAQGLQVRSGVGPRRRIRQGHL